MTYTVLKSGEHPIAKTPIKPGAVLLLFHTVGDPHTKGKKPLLRRTTSSTKVTNIAVKHIKEQEEEDPARQETYLEPSKLTYKT